MFRITKTENGARSVLIVEGELRSDCVDTVEVCCDQAVARGRPVDLFLRDVSAIDLSGMALLRRLAGRGIRLAGSGVYTSYLLRELGSPGARRVQKGS